MIIADIIIRDLSRATITKIDEKAKELGYKSRNEFLRSYLERQFLYLDKLIEYEGKYELLFDKVLKVLDYTETDSSDKDRLEKYFGSIRNWEVKEVEYKKDIKIIKVSNSYKLKDYLQMNGYKYSKLEQVWFKEMKVGTIYEEIESLKKLIDAENIKVIDRNDLEIEAIYYIAVLNSYNHREILKENGYIYNGYGIEKKSWNKKIKANELEREKELLNKLDGVKFKIINKKNKTYTR